MSFSWPTYSKKEISLVSKILKSGRVNYWTGEECKKFEDEYAKFTNTKYAISLANGTLALDLSLKAISIKEGDEVIVTSRTYIASVSSIVNAGAKPVFADVEYETQNISINTIKKLISRKTKAVICVHLAGWPCDMDPIIQHCRKRNIYIVEDCAQAHGAKYKGKSVGSIGDIGCWSFCNDKIISTGGEGGMVTTNNKNLWLKMWSYKDHGKSFYLSKKKNYPNKFVWLHKNFGSNFRMTELQAAIGRYQLSRLSEWNKIRRRNANVIWDTVKNLPNFRVGNLKCSGCDGKCKINKGCVHAAYKCYIFVKGSSVLRDKFLKVINSKKIPCFVGSCPEVYMEEAFKKNNLYPKKRYKTCKTLGETSLMLLCHQNISYKDLKNTCNVLIEASDILSK